MKKFYRENRIFSIMMLVSTVCIALILGFFYVYFFHGEGTNKYGNRLDGINEIKLDKNKFTQLQEEVSEDKNILAVSGNLQGKIVYITIKISEESEQSEGINTSLKLLGLFSEEEQNYFDFSFTIDKENKDEEELYPIYGYKNAESANIVWTKY